MPGINVPEYLGCMVLPDCVLFPHGAMPLNIFEPRYREMLADSLKGDCVFGIVNRISLPDGTGLPATVGTAGLVRASKQRNDGTSELIVHGVLRIRIEEWLDDHSYPYARISPISMDQSGADSVTSESQMKRLRQSIENALTGVDEQVSQPLIDLLGKARNPGIFTDLVSQHFVQNPVIRQYLLETNDAQIRLDRLMKEFRLSN